LFGEAGRDEAGLIIFTLFVVSLEVVAVVAAADSVGGVDGLVDFFVFDLIGDTERDVDFLAGEPVAIICISNQVTIKEVVVTRRC
jgi:hypothetical protein